MEDDPKKLALLLVGKPKKGGAPEGEGEAEGDESSEGMGPNALKDMYSMMKSGDFGGAFEALKAAVSYCSGEED